jgi:hypothetical protein
VLEIIEDPKRGRPRKDGVGQKHYQISATLIPQPNAMDVEIQRAGRFMLASNVLDEQVLGDEDENQVGKSTAKPTLRWMFQCFMSIHLLTVDGAKHVTNLTTERLWILQFFGAPCRQILSPFLIYLRNAGYNC